MAKKTEASLQKKGAKAFTKAVKMVKNEILTWYNEMLQVKILYVYIQLLVFNLYLYTVSI